MLSDLGCPTKLSKINPTTNTVAATVGNSNLGASPFGLAFDGASIWVADYFSGTVSKISV